MTIRIDAAIALGMMAGVLFSIAIGISAGSKFVINDGQTGVPYLVILGALFAILSWHVGNEKSV